MLAVLAEKEDPTGETRVRDRDQGKALAGQITLNRLELTKAEVSETERYKNGDESRGGGLTTGEGVPGVIRGSAGRDCPLRRSDRTQSHLPEFGISLRSK